MSTPRAYFIRSWYYFAQVLGLSAYTFDFRTQRLQRHPLLYCYCVGISILLLLTMPIYHHIGTNYLQMYEAKPLMNIVSCYNVELQCLIILYHVIMRRNKDRAFCRIVRQLVKLHKAARCPTLRQCDDYAWLFYSKYATFCLQSGTFFMSLIGVYGMRALNLSDLILNLYYLLIWNVLHTTLLSYFLVLLHICRRFCAINARLQQIYAAHLQFQNITLNASELYELRAVLYVHRKLQSTVVALNRLFAYDVFAIMLLFFMANNVIFYMAFIYLTNSNCDHTVSYILLVMFVMQLADIFLLFYCCDALLSRQRETAVLLREWQHLTKTKYDDEFQQLCETFSLNLALTNFRINIYGMFDLDKRRAFAILRTTIMHTIILMQFDYILQA